MSLACFELWWFLIACKIKSKFLRVAHKEGLSKNWILGLLALITLSCRGQPYTFCFRHLETTMAHFSLLFFASAWNMEAHPPSLTQTTPLLNDISSRRLSLNLALTQASGSWEHRAISSPHCPALRKQQFWNYLSFNPTGLARVQTLSKCLINACLINREVSVLFPQHAGSIRSGAVKMSESEVM